jgi:hypothetical protein
MEPFPAPEPGICPKCGRPLPSPAAGRDRTHCLACGCPLRPGLRPLSSATSGGGRSLNPWARKTLMFVGGLLGFLVYKVFLAASGRHPIEAAYFDRWNAPIAFMVGSLVSWAIVSLLWPGSDEAPVGRSVGGMKACVHCGQAMPRAADFCTHCKRLQTESRSLFG